MEPLPFGAPSPRQKRALHRNRSRWQVGPWRRSEGRLRPWLTNDPPASHITRVLWHALDGHFYGRDYSLSEAKAAGFNTCACVTYTGTMTVPQVVAAGEAVGIYVVPILREGAPPVQDVETYDAAEVVKAWYVFDEPSLAQLPIFESRKAQWRTTKPMFMAAARASYEQYRDRWLRCVSESEIVCHSNYYYLYNTFPRAYSFHAPTVAHQSRYPSLTQQSAATWLHRDSSHGVNLPLGQRVAERHYKEHWFLCQAHGKMRRSGDTWIVGGSDPCQPFDYPTRAQVFYALASGCTGYGPYAYDSWFLRGAAQYGIASDPPLDYGQGGAVVTERMRTHMVEMWGVWAEINSRVEAIEHVFLSRSSALDYVVEYQNDTYTWAEHPIQVNCREYGNEFWFIVVNIENFPHPVRLRLPFAPASATKYYGPGVVQTLSGDTLSMTMPGWGVWVGTVKKSA